MKVQRKFRDIVLRQLQQYALSKRLIAEYEEVRLPHGELGLGIIVGDVGDPTANQAIRLVDPDEHMKNIYSWVWAIERAYELFLVSEQDKASLMEHLFGLNGHEICYDTRARRERLINVLHVSEPTLYRWREDIICAVMLGAIQKGLLEPYGGAFGSVAAGHR